MQYPKATKMKKKIVWTCKQVEAVVARRLVITFIVDHRKLHLEHLTAEKNTNIVELNFPDFVHFTVRVCLCICVCAQVAVSG